MEIDAVRQLGVYFGVTISERQVVNGCTGLRIDRAPAVVEERTLVVVHVLRSRGPREQVPRKLHQVVGAAIFGRFRAELRGKHPRIGSPKLEIAGTSRAE